MTEVYCAKSLALYEEYRRLSADADMHSVAHYIAARNMRKNAEARVVEAMVLESLGAAYHELWDTYRVKANSYIKRAGVKSQFEKQIQDELAAKGIVHETD